MTDRRRPSRDRRAPRRRRGAVALALLAAGGLAAGCELNEVVVAQPPTSLVVHAVLNTDADSQLVLVEETLTGRVQIDTTLRYDPADPIRTGGGVPASGARVVIARPATGDSVVAVERVIGGRPTGVYVFDARPGVAGALSIDPAARYTLRIETVDGRVVTGATTVPGPIPGWVRGAGLVPTPQAIDRARDTVQLAWANIPGARTYGVRVETPYGPWFFFNDSTRFALAGSLRNFFTAGVPSVWVPGFVQRTGVAAVDTAFFDYYRSGNDPFGGTGLISRLDGAIGLFASAVPLLSRDVSVTQAALTPLDARWAAPGDTFDLWLESPGPDRSAVSGAARIATAPAARPGVLGSLQGDRLRLAALRGASPSDTLWTFDGRQRGDSITGTVSVGGAGRAVTLRRAGPPFAP